MAPESNHTRLVQLCPTRWCDKHEAVITFVELFTPVVKTLEALSLQRSDEKIQPENLLNTDQIRFYYRNSCTQIFCFIFATDFSKITKPEAESFLLSDRDQKSDRFS